MDGLLEIARRDRGFRDDIGRRALIALFGVLGEDDPRTQRCRDALAMMRR